MLLRKRRLVVAVAAVVLATACIWWLSGRSKRSIERVLAADRGAYQQHEKGLRAGRSESVREMVQQMKSINLSGCPAAFRIAYLEHCNAWTAVGERWKANNDQGLFWLLICGFRAYSGDLRGAGGTLVTMARLNDKQEQKVLLASWEKVEAVSASYGAK
jgi:hypothetical protein